MPADSSHRGALVNVLWLLGLSLGMLLLFALTVLVAGVVVYLIKGTPLTSPQNISLGLICALVVTLFLTIFHLKKEIILLPYQDRPSLRARVKKEMQGLGYQVLTDSDGELTFIPPFHSWLMGGRVRVELQDGSARITGPKVYLEMLRNNLRIQSHVDDLRASIRDSRILQVDQLLKRIQLNMRLTPDQLPGIQQGIIEVLAKEGTEVFCDVNIMAQNEQGMWQRQVELPIRDWLQKQGIKAEISREKLEVKAPAIGESEKPEN